MEQVREPRPDWDSAAGMAEAYCKAAMEYLCRPILDQSPASDLGHRNANRIVEYLAVTIADPVLSVPDEFLSSILPANYMAVCLQHLNTDRICLAARGFSLLPVLSG